MPNYKVLFELEKIMISINGQQLLVSKKFVDLDFVASQINNKTVFVDLYNFEIETHEGVLGSDIIGVLLGFDPRPELKKEILIDTIMFNMFHIVKHPDLLKNGFDITEQLINLLSPKYYELHTAIDLIIGKKLRSTESVKNVSNKLFTVFIKTVTDRYECVKYDKNQVSFGSSKIVCTDSTNITDEFKIFIHCLHQFKSIDYASILEEPIKKELIAIVDVPELVDEIFELYFRSRYSEITMDMVNVNSK